MSLPNALRRLPCLGWLFAAVWLTGCLAGPDATSAPRAVPVSAAGPNAPLHMRVALPESAVGRVDSAEVRVVGPDGTVRAPMAIRDSILEADLDFPVAASAEAEVHAYSGGTLAYYGAASLDPDPEGRAGLRVTLEPVGRVRLEASFAPAL